MTNLRIILIALTAAVFAGCGADRERTSEFNSKPFETFSGSAILCFDVQADNGTAKAGLLLRVSQKTPAGRHEIMLPFRTRSVDTNRNILLTSGSYERFTLLSLSFGTPSLGTSTVAFIPEIAQMPTPLAQIDGLEPGVYFQESGIERWFAYVDGTAEVVNSIQKDFTSETIDPIDGIALAIPEDADGRDVRKGVSVIPQPTNRIGNVMLFSPSTNGETKRVAMRYAVKPTPAQAVAANVGVKVVVIIIIPILTLIFLNPDEVQRPKLRTMAIWTGIALQVAIAAFVVWMAFSIRKPTIEAVVDLAVAALGVGGEAVIILVKSKRKMTSGTNPPQSPA